MKGIMPSFCMGLSTGALLVIAWRLGEISIWLQGM